MMQNDKVRLGKLKFVLCITKFGGVAIVVIGLLYLVWGATPYFYSAYLKIRYVVETCPWEIVLCLLYFGLVVCFIRSITLIFKGSVGWIKSVKEKRRAKKQCSSPESLQSNGVEFSDAPISGEGEDVFYRGVYVRKLATLIAHLPKKEAGYIGVYGEWGEGKTSVRNLLVEYFKNEDSKISPLFLDFSPWEYPEKTDLRSVFFEVISEKLAHNNIRTISKIFSLLSKGFKIRRINNELGALHECIDWIRSLFSITLTNDYLIQCAKHELSELDRQIIIVIDDLDRLTNDEVCQLLRFLKANGDLPNMVYLILADENHLGQSIQRMVRGRGREFIEKIIPFSCPLPPINKEALKNFLKMEIEKLLKAYELTFPDDDDAYDRALEYTQTPRKLKRLINTFSIDLAGLKLQVAGRRYLNVHLGDLLVLTVVKLFEPECYRRLFSLFKEMELRASREDVLSREGVTQEWLYEKFLKYVNFGHAEWLKAFIEARLEIRLKEDSLSQSREMRYVLSKMVDPQSRRGFRLSSRLCFPNYFLQRSDNLKLTQDDLHNFEFKIKNLEDVQELLRQFDQEQKLTQLCEVLENQEVFPTEEISLFFIESLVKISNTLLSPPTYADIEYVFDYSIYERLFRVVYAYIEELKSYISQQERNFDWKIGDKILLPILDRNENFSISMWFIRAEWQKHSSEDARYDALFSNEGFKTLLKVFLTNVIKLQNIGQFVTYPDVQNLFYEWVRALKTLDGFLLQTQSVCKSIIENKESLRIFMELLVDEDEDNVNYDQRIWTVNVDTMLLFFDDKNTKQIALNLKNGTIFPHKWKEIGIALEWALHEKENGQDYSCAAQRQFILNRRNADTTSEKEE